MEAVIEPVQEEPKQLSSLDLLLARSDIQITDEGLKETKEALAVITSIYPSLRLDAPEVEGGDYENKRANFKNVIDQIEAALFTIEKYFPSPIPTFHKFTPGMYIREVHVPAGCIFTSVTHKTRHPFVISQGVCDICNEIGEVNRFSAPHTGITEPGTRRVFLVHSDLVLTTFHATDITDPDEWLLHNTKIESEMIPEGATIKCFSRKGLKWQE
jgi:hypothetical protein